MVKSGSFVGPIYGPTGSIPTSMKSGPPEILAKLTADFLAGTPPYYTIICPRGDYIARRLRILNWRCLVWEWGFLGGWSPHVPWGEDMGNQ